MDQIQEEECFPDCVDAGNVGVDVVTKSNPDGDSSGDRGSPATLDDSGSEGAAPLEAGTDTSTADTSSPSPDSGAGGLDAAADSQGLDTGIDTGPLVDAPIDTSPGSPEGGCGPTNTVQNCGACGQSCAPTSASTSSTSCSGTACTYTCSAGHLDCNASLTFDPDGCECNVTNTASAASCCSTTCPVQHTDGVTESGFATTVNYYDCNPVGTYTAATAQEACLNFTGGNASECVNAKCDNSTTDNTVCAQTPNACPCWQYAGSFAGSVVVGIGTDVTQCWCPGPASNTTTTTWQ